MERVSIGPNGETPRNKSHGDGRGDSRANYSAQDSMSDHKSKGKPRSLRFVRIFNIKLRGWSVARILS